MDESLLSPELLQEFGGASDIIVPNRSKQKRPRPQSSTQEEDEVDVKLSKRAKKKIEQLKAKKEKEAKRSHYYEVLERNKMPEEQRKLLISSRDASTVGSQSTKSRVKRAFHLQKAGITLSEEDENLLFSSKKKSDSDPAEENSAQYAEIFKSHKDAQNKHETVTAQKMQAKLALPVSAADISDDDGEEAPALVPAPSVGISLLEQFKKIKGALDVNADLQETEASDMEEDNSPEVEGESYVPVEIDLPVDNFGNVKRRADVAAGDSVGLSSKLKYIVERDPEIQAARMKLPVCSMEQEIVEAIAMHDVVILCGETGSGKSTQVPQFMYEAGYGAHGLIGVTQPRRVAAVSTAHRVAQEMGVFWDKKKTTTKKAKPFDRHMISGDEPEEAEGDGELVGYQIRHDATTFGSKTRIKFMTDGILLKEISSDLLLKNYSVVFLDEAHERNVNTDVLIGMISRSIPMRRKQHEQEMSRWMSIPVDERHQYEPPIQPLKLVIMSATMRVNDFTNPVLFSRPPPIVKVEARQFPVVSHFSRRTEMDNYLHETFRKVCQIHRKLPGGGILVFLTGKREIVHMVRKLSRHLNTKSKRPQSSTESHEIKDVSDMDANLDSAGAGGTASKAAAGSLDDRENEADAWMDSREKAMIEAFANEDEGDFEDDDDDEDLGVESIPDLATSSTSFVSGSMGANVVDGDDERSALLREVLGDDAARAKESVATAAAETDKQHQLEEEGDTPVSSQPTHVLALPLFAMLSAEQQRKVFEQPPEGHRLIVVATNVAETSITIPGIRYVVDCGRQKDRIVDLKSGISTYKVTWISKASADQRQGRAGRTGPGHCYRLYSSAFYDQHMPAFREPEICSTPLEDLILQLRSLGIDKVERFPFPSPPPAASLNKAYRLLTYIGALRDNVAEEKKKMTALESIDAILKPRSLEGETNRAGLTSLGKLISKFPIHVRLAKMIIIAHKTGSLPISLVAGLVACVTERSPFTRLDNNAGKSAEDDASENSEDEDDEDSEGQQEMWMHSTSDILARLRALGAFAYAKKQTEKEESKSKRDKKKRSKSKAKGSESANDGEEDKKSPVSVLCSKFGLQYNTLCRCLELQQQLCSLSTAIFAKNDKIKEGGEERERVEDLDTLPPPDSAQEVALRQVMLTGLTDCIARKAPLGSLEVTPGMSRRKRLTAYLSCDPAITTPIYIHPHSALFRKDPTASLPEYVSYNELVTNEKEDTTYMAGVTEISSSWIPQLCRDCPLLQWMPFLTDPKPFFSDEEDAVMCFAPLTYGIHKWELSPVERRMSDCSTDEGTEGGVKSDVGGLVGYRKQDEIFRWFSRLLIEGKVVKDYGLPKVFKKVKMAEVPSLLTSLKLNKKASALLDRITRDRVCSLDGLKKHLKQDPVYLSAEIQPFIKTEFRKEFRLSWKAFARVCQEETE